MASSMPAISAGGAVSSLACSSCMRRLKAMSWSTGSADGFTATLPSVTFFHCCAMPLSKLIL